MSDEQTRQKQAAARHAAASIRDGMVAGLGTGSTAELVIRALAERVRCGLDVVGVATSVRSARLAEALGVRVVDVQDVSRIDLTFDGADEVEPRTLGLLKGRGGALLREKLVAIASDRELIVVDDSKIVDVLGSHGPVPVEVVPYGWRIPVGYLEALGGSCTLRRDTSGQPFITDNHNYILDVSFGPITDPVWLDREIKLIRGVVEHGLFVDIADEVVVGRPSGIEVLTR